jgi:hypothetical protein
MVSVVEPVMEFKVAAMAVAPCATLVAKPWLPLALLIVATLVADELQVTDAVRFCGLPLLKFPVATNCCDEPREREGLAGVTVIEDRPVTLPVPVSATVRGLPEALKGMVSVPGRAPTTVGENVTPTPHVAPAARDAPHVLLAIAKSPATAIVSSVRVELSWLVTVTV